MAAGRILTAGRSESNDIAVEHPTISRRHIKLRINDDASFDVFDLGSSAGTFVFHKGEWTRFEHATVAREERLRLGTYETTAGALLALAGEGADSAASPPDEDIHEVTTHRRGERPPRKVEVGEDADRADSGEEEQTTRRESDRATKKLAGASNRGPQTMKLPARHAASGAKPEPAPRPARTKADPLASPAGSEITTHPSPKSLGVTYLLWFFLGGFGAHRFYLGSIAIGIAQATLLVVGVVPVIVFGDALYDKTLPTIFVLLGVAVLTCLAVWWIVDGFLIPGLVRARGGKP